MKGIQVSSREISHAAVAPDRQKSDVGRLVAKSGGRVSDSSIMHLAVVACGNRLEETLTMVKSALIFSIKKIKFHIFAEEDLSSEFEKGVCVMSGCGILVYIQKCVFV